MARTLKDSQDNTQAIKPWPVYSKLRLVCKHLVPGHQEDAHEFLRYLVEAMEKAYLLRFKNSKEFDQYTKETTPLNQILGGYLKSSVRCLTCAHVSVTFQHFEDLLLDIRKVNSIEEALDTHFARERLEDMGYKCEACKKKVSATKQFSLERAPISLCIQLKRFSMMGGKINKHVTFRPRLDLSKYASKKTLNDRPLNYRLVALVTHLGASQHCGHYTAIGLTSTGNYYHFDDSCVRPISLQSVLLTNAYIMFYELEGSSSGLPTIVTAKQTCTVTSKTATDTNTTLSAAATTTTDNATTFIGPVFPTDFNKACAKFNGLDSSVPSSTVTTATAPSPPPPPPITPTSKLVLNISNNSNVAKPWTGTKSTLFANRLAAISNGHTKGSKILNGTTIKDEAKAINSNGNSTSTNATTTTTTTEPITKKIIKFSNGCHNNENNKSETQNQQRLTLPSMPKLDINSPSINNGTPLLTPLSSQIQQQQKITHDNKTIISSTFASSSQIKLIALSKTTNGHVNNKMLQPTKPLVPYTVDDDSSDYNNHSDDDSNNRTPPVIKSKTGPWQVTSAYVTNGNSGGSSSSNSSTSGSGRSTPNYAGGIVNRFNVDDANKNVSAADLTVSKLIKYTHQGYGGTVSTWNGQTSNMEKEVSFFFFIDLLRFFIADLQFHIVPFILKLVH